MIALSYTESVEHVDLWVFVETEDFAVNRQIYELQDKFHHDQVQLSIIPVDQSDPTGLPKSFELWRRAKVRA